MLSCPLPRDGCQRLSEAVGKTSLVRLHSWTIRTRLRGFIDELHFKPAKNYPQSSENSPARAMKQWPDVSGQHAAHPLTAGVGRPCRESRGAHRRRVAESNAEARLSSSRSAS